MLARFFCTTSFDDMDPVENDDAGTAGRVCSWNWTCKKIELASTGAFLLVCPELLRPFTPTSAGAGEAQQPLPNGAHRRS